MEALILRVGGAQRRDVRVGWLMLRALLLTLIAVRVMVGPLADASPADPAWIGGMYDGGDFDDVVDQLASLATICDGVAAPPVFRFKGGGVALWDLPPAPGAGRNTPHDRAPPSV